MPADDPAVQPRLPDDPDYPNGAATRQGCCAECGQPVDLYERTCSRCHRLVCGRACETAHVALRGHPGSLCVPG